MSRGATTGGAGSPSPPASPVNSVDLVLLPKAAVWHITHPDAPGRSLCNANLDYELGGRRESGIDARVVSQRGKKVCVRCRRNR